MGRRIQAFFGNRVRNRVEHLNAMVRAKRGRSSVRSSKRPGAYHVISNCRLYRRRIGTSRVGKKRTRRENRIIGSRYSLPAPAIATY